MNIGAVLVDEGMVAVEVPVVERPHVVALIDLDEGVRMMSNLVRDESPDYPSIDPDDVSTGMRVRVVFHDVTDEITLPKFVPA